MKLKISVTSTFDEDSEQETAIDFVKITQEFNEYTLQTLNGTKIIISHDEVKKSYSYLEPDLMNDAAILKAQTTGQAMPNILQDSPSVQKDIYSSLKFIIDEPLVVLTKQEFQEYFINYSRMSTEEKEQAREESPPNSNFDKFFRFESQQNHNLIKLNEAEYKTYQRVYESADEESQRLYDSQYGSRFANFYRQETLNKFLGQRLFIQDSAETPLVSIKKNIPDFIDQIHKAMQEPSFSSNKYVEVNIPPELIPHITFAENEQMKIKSNNSGQLIQTMAENANTKIEYVIKQMADSAIDAMNERNKKSRPT